MRIALRHSFLAALFLLALAPFGPALADSIEDTSTYYRLQPDLRLCPSPLCGGYFVSRVNRLYTRCADGTHQMVCHVSTVDWTRLGLDEKTLNEFRAATNEGRTIVRGRIRPGQEFAGFGPLGELVATEGWLAASSVAPEGFFFRVYDNGIVCIAAPCFSIHEAKLNSTVHRDISEVNLARTGATEEQRRAAEQAIHTSSLLVAGRNRTVPDAGPAGDGIKLVATQFYLRIGSSP